MAVKVLDQGLRGKHTPPTQPVILLLDRERQRLTVPAWTDTEDFGFKHLMWVYSGRRGIHLWISDPSALVLSDDQRKAIVNYVDLFKAGAKMDKKVELKRPLHPAIARARDLLLPYFEKVILLDQNCFVREEQWDTLLSILPDKRKSLTSHSVAHVRMMRC